MISTRPVRKEDADRWRDLRVALWPEASADVHAAEIGEFFAGRAREPVAVLVAENMEGDIIGFVELSIRTSAEGCETDHVAFVEGWFVVREARRRGVGRALMAAAETWGRTQGCAELGSDTQASNRISRAAHAATGFEEVALVRCFRKAL